MKHAHERIVIYCKDVDSKGDEYGVRCDKDDESSDEGDRHGDAENKDGDSYSHGEAYEVRVSKSKD